ncbi:MAG TPA: nodulation protein NfeD [Ignavibacteriaceae bacterium]|nr:nodulation protein NfeD [Ignavibacteriaceae bacterium]
MIRKISLVFFIIISSIQLFGQTQKVVVLTLNGAINPAASDYIKYGIENSVKDNAQCMVLRLNTPGGLLESTRDIVSDILQSPIPIIVYVAPQGSRAASAGVFITLSANIAAMAPGTNIGAAHPVSLEGKMDSTMTEKVTNDAAAFIRSISEKRKRNVKWAEDAVRNSISITETEALKDSVIDLIANNLNDLLVKIDGKEITTESGVGILHTKDAKIIYVNMTLQQKLLSLLSDPNIYYILFMLGTLGLLFELYNPGAIFPGVIGVISLILSFYSMNTLPINYAGLALIIFGIILFVLEIKIVSHGILTVGGVTSLVLGSFMLINTNATMGGIDISWELIILIAALTLGFFLFAIGYGIKAQRLKPKTGREGIINAPGEAITDLTPKGQVRVHGEIWNAESTEGNIFKGEKIVVSEISNLKLIIRRAK